MPRTAPKATVIATTVPSVWVSTVLRVTASASAAESSA